MMKKNKIISLCLILITFLSCKQAKEIKETTSELNNKLDNVLVKENNQELYVQYTSRTESDFKIELLKFENDYKIKFKTLEGKLLYSSLPFKVDKEISKTIYNCYSINSKGEEDGGGIYILRSEKEDVYLKSWKKLKLNIAEVKEEEACQDDGP